MAVRYWLANTAAIDQTCALSLFHTTLHVSVQKRVWISHPATGYVSDEKEAGYWLITGYFFLKGRPA